MTKTIGDSDIGATSAWDDSSEKEQPGRSMGEDMAAAAGGVAGTARAAVGTAREAARSVADQLPAAADTARSAVDQANRQMQSSPDDMLMTGAALAFGITIGLFISGANRLAVALALVPAVAMGATLMDRRTRTSI